MRFLILKLLFFLFPPAIGTKHKTRTNQKSLKYFLKEKKQVGERNPGARQKGPGTTTTRMRAAASCVSGIQLKASGRRLQE